MNDIILRTEKITKGFFGVPVLKGIDFEVKKGEVMGLVGENGAGKSTLMKIVTGLYSLDSGDIFLDGRKVQFRDSKEAQEMGIAIIHQEFNLFSNLSVAENIFLDRKEYRNRLGKINWKKMKRDARTVLSDLGAPDLDVEIPVRLLSVREQQLVEISKAVSANARVLIMDEPSAALPVSEVQKMFDVIKMLKNKGVAIVYISHRMMEIEQICNRVTVLRDGVSQGVIEIEAGAIDRVISMMIGREITDYYPHSKRAFGETVLKVENLSGSCVEKVDLHVRKGEVVGLYGLAGAGTTEVAEMIMGLQKYKNGNVSFENKIIAGNSIQSSMNAGIGYIPSDRRQEGVVVKMPIDQNIILANLKKYKGKFLINQKEIVHSVESHIKKLQIKCVDTGQQVQRLSGGNQQKVVLAKWLDRNPRMLILNEPTRGVDIGAKSEIYRLIDELASEGMPILLISSEVPEVLGISDRIIVMCRGRVTGEYENEYVGQDVLLKAASSAMGGGVKNE